MARTSRINAPVILSEPVQTVYRTAIYVRLSVLNGNKDDGESIENQEAMLRGYIENKPCFSLRSVYSDNGETGVNFDRDGFERLIGDVKSGTINCIIVKDLSRFGRNYIEAGEYLEKIFPFLGVRFIAVNDGYDSIDPLSSDILSMHLKNLVNDIYARDISNKISPVLRAKQERGEFIGAWAAYGYLKSKEDKHKIVVDDETAPIVRDIFAWRLTGLSNQMIARKLTELSIPSPSRYRFEKGLVKDKRFETAPWQMQTIKAMLSNQIYLGHMVQGKKRKSLYHGQKQTFLPKDQWIIVENTHEAIIDRKTFDAVQWIDEARRQEYFGKSGRYGNVGNPENILKGMIVCGCCGTKLVRHKIVRVNKIKEPKHHVWYSYVCPAHAADPGKCSFTSVKETLVLDAVLGWIRKEIAVALEMKKLIESARHRAVVSSEQNTLTAEIEKAKQALVRIRRLRERLYDDYLDELLTERDYLYSQERYKAQEAEQNERLTMLLDRQKHITKTKTRENLWLKSFLNFCDNPELTAGIVAELVDSITVNLDSTVRVTVRYQDEYGQLNACLPSREVAAGE